MHLSLSNVYRGRWWLMNLLGHRCLASVKYTRLIQNSCRSLRGPWVTSDKPRSAQGRKPLIIRMHVGRCTVPGLSTCGLFSRDGDKCGVLGHVLSAGHSRICYWLLGEEIFTVPEPEPYGGRWTGPPPTPSLFKITEKLQHIRMK